MSNIQRLETSLTWAPAEVSGTAKSAFSKNKREVKKISANDAGSGQPPSDSTEQYGVQNEIFTEACEAARGLASKFQKDKEKARDSLANSCTINPLSSEEDDVSAQNARQNAESIYETEENEFLSRRENYWGSTVALRKFRVDNDLNKPADYPDSQIMNGALVFAALAAETVLNGTMFSAVSEGLIDGWGRAFIFSVINILLGGILGFFGMRYVFHVNGLFKAFAAVFSILLIFVGIGWNLFVAHYREVAAESIGGVSQFSAFTRLIDAPFDLGSVEAVALFVFGLAVFGIMAYKAFSGFADKYPGYMNMDRKRLATEESYEFLEAEVRSDIEDAFDIERGKLEEEIEEQKHRADKAEANVKMILNQRAKINKQLDDIARRGNDLLRTYRETVKRIRNNVVVAHFDEYLTRDVILDGMDDEFDSEEIANLGRLLRDTAEANRRILETRIGALVQAEKETLLAYNDWLDVVDRRATVRVDTGYSKNVTADELRRADADARKASLNSEDEFEDAEATD